MGMPCSGFGASTGCFASSAGAGLAGGLARGFTASTATRASGAEGDTSLSTAADFAGSGECFAGGTTRGMRGTEAGLGGAARDTVGTRATGATASGAAAAIGAFAAGALRALTVSVTLAAGAA